MDKMLLKKKAIEALMSESKGLAGMKKKMPMDMEAMDEPHAEGEMNKEGMEQMLVSAEEKAMIMNMRKGAGAEEKDPAQMMAEME